MKAYKQIILLLTSVLLLQTCKKDEERLDAELVISPSTIFVTETTGKFYLSVQPGYKVDWEIDRKPFWMEIKPSKGRLQKGIIELNYTIYPDYLNEGLHLEQIVIKSNRVRSATANIHIEIGRLRIAEFSPSQLHLSDEVSETEFSLNNIGNSTLAYELQPDKDWVTLSRYQGYLSSGASTKIMLTVNRTSLPVGTEQAQITAKINSSIEGPVLSINMAVPPHVQLGVSAPEIHFGYFQNQKSIYLINRGNVPSNWSLQIADNYIYANQTTGILQSNDSVNLNFTINREFLSSQTFHSELHFSANPGQGVIVPVLIDNYIEEKWLIEGWVLNATYDRIHDKLYLIFDNSHQLKRLNPHTNVIENITLENQPTAISISQDGNFAAVAHGSKFSYVNLNNLQIENIYQFNFNIHDILLANGWVYLFPEYGEPTTKIQCLHLETGDISQNTGSTQTVLLISRLHPSGNHFICGSPFFTVKDLRKFDIAGGTAHFLYSSNTNALGYHFGSNFWIADDGTRAFSNTRNIYTLSDNPSLDFNVVGQLFCDTQIIGFDYSSIAGVSYATIAFAPESNLASNYIRKYSNQNMTFEDDIPLPGFLYPSHDGMGRFFESEGRYVFFNSQGTQLYVVVRSWPGSGSLNDWAIVTMDL
jgi:hypothetical protein